MRGERIFVSCLRLSVLTYLARGAVWWRAARELEAVGRAPGLPFAPGLAPRGFPRVKGAAPSTILALGLPAVHLTQLEGIFILIY